MSKRKMGARSHTARLWFILLHARAHAAQATTWHVKKSTRNLLPLSHHHRTSSIFRDPKYRRLCPLWLPSCHQRPPTRLPLTININMIQHEHTNHRLSYVMLIDDIHVRFRSIPHRLSSWKTQKSVSNNLIMFYPSVNHFAKLALNKFYYKKRIQLRLL